MSIDSSIQSTMQEETISTFNDFKKKHNTPVIIEVSGTPNSGKTTTIAMLTTYFKQVVPSLRVNAIGEAANSCKVKEKLSPIFNEWTALETLRVLQEAESSRYDIVFCERGVFDALCWLKFHFDNGSVTKDEYDIMSSFYLLPRFVQRVNLLILMKCNVETSIERENRMSLISAERTIVNKHVLTKFNSAVEDVYSKYGEQFVQPNVLDTTGLNPHEISENFLGVLTQHLRKQ